MVGEMCCHTPSGTTLLPPVVKLPYTGWHSDGVDRSPGVCSGWKNGTMDICSPPLLLPSSSLPSSTANFLPSPPHPLSPSPSSSSSPSPPLFPSSLPPFLSSFLSSFLHKVTVEYIQDMCSRLFGESMQQPPDLQRPTTVSTLWCGILWYTVIYCNIL